MDWNELFRPSLALPVAAFVAGVVTKSVIERFFNISTNRALEALRSELRMREEGFKEQQSRLAATLSTLRSGVLGLSTGRHSALDEKRLACSSALWEEVVKLSELKPLGRTLENVKVDFAIAEAARQDNRGEKVREFAKVLWDAMGLDDRAKGLDARRLQMFVDPMAWLRFEAYRSVLGLPVAQLAVMKTGVGSDALVDSEPLKNAVMAAFPHFEPLVKELGTAIFPTLYDSFEQAIMQDLLKSLEGEQPNRNDVARIAKLLADLPNYEFAGEAPAKAPFEIAK